MDLSQFEITDDDIGVMEVRHPGTGTPIKDAAGNSVTISMVSLDSPRYRAAMHKITNRRLKDRSRGGLSAEEAERQMIESMAASIVDWSGIGIGAEETPFSPQMAGDVLERLPWLFRQVNEFLGNQANFMKASPEA